MIFPNITNVYIVDGIVYIYSQVPYFEMMGTCDGCTFFNNKQCRKDEVLPYVKCDNKRYNFSRDIGKFKGL